MQSSCSRIPGLCSLSLVWSSINWIPQNKLVLRQPISDPQPINACTGSNLAIHFYALFTEKKGCILMKLIFNVFLMLGIFHAASNLSRGIIPWSHQFWFLMHTACSHLTLQIVLFIGYCLHIVTYYSKTYQHSENMVLWNKIGICKIKELVREYSALEFLLTALLIFNLWWKLLAFSLPSFDCSA